MPSESDLIYPSPSLLLRSSVAFQSPAWSFSDQWPLFDGQISKRSPRGWESSSSPQPLFPVAAVDAVLTFSLLHNPGCVGGDDNDSPAFKG